jgi:hypothetical protein
MLESEEFTNTAYEAFLNLFNNSYEAEKIESLGELFANEIYMPCSERLIYTETTDIDIDSWPVNSSIYLPEVKTFSYAKKINAFPKNLIGINKGQKLKVHVFKKNEETLESENYYSTIKKNGDIRPGVCVGAHNSPSYYGYSMLASSLALNGIHDSKYLWSATVDEKVIGEHKTRLKLGFDREQIKSLFYARSLPLTETGRKRPILHLVRAHNRRIEKGIDIDVDRHIRGVDSVSIDSMVFKIRPPIVESDLHKRWAV